MYRIYKCHHKEQKNKEAVLIYPDYLEEQIFKYCQLANIPLIHGTVPARYREEVEKFIRVRIKTDRLRTRKIEETQKISINPVVQTMISNTVESPIEEFMMQAFVSAGINQHCRLQFEIGKKRVDFAFPVANLVVECDGRNFHFGDEAQIEKDQKRDQYLAKRGWRVKHFDGLMIRRNITDCIAEIKEILDPYLKDAKPIEMKIKIE